MSNSRVRDQFRPRAEESTSNGKANSDSRNRRQRNQVAAYKHSQENVSWDEAREFEERPLPKGKPTARSSAFKAKRKEDSRKPRKERVPFDESKYLSTEDSEPNNTIDYEVLPGVSSIPIESEYSQNFDLSSFPILLRSIFNELQELNPRLEREIPFAVFQHVYTSFANAVLIDRVKECNQRTVHTEQWALDLYQGDYLVPTPIIDYLSKIATTILETGEKVVVNIPEIAIPAGSNPNYPSGSFGIANAQNHNVYECYVSPLVTSNMVLDAFREAQQHVPPLPAALVPTGGVPTPDLLGYIPGQAQVSPDARARYGQIVFPDDDTLVGILKINGALDTKAQSALAPLADRYSFDNLHGMKRIQQHEVQSNSAFSEYLPSGGEALTTGIPTVFSRNTFTGTTYNLSVLYGLHVRRSAAAPGCCYLVGGAPPADWSNTRNSNFSMAEPFDPVVYPDLADLRAAKNQVLSVFGKKYNPLKVLMARFKKKQLKR